jgi:hypothetical protein
LRVVSGKFNRTVEGVMPQRLRPVIEALDGLHTALVSTSAELKTLAERTAALKRECESVEGGLAETMAGEARPLIVTRMTQLIDDLADAAAAVRRAEARQLRAEGLSHEQIAKVFGVTRQRAAALLAPPPPPGARAAKRPRS